MDPRNIVAPLVTPTRVERSVPLKALVAQINYNLFDMELGQQQSQFAYLQAKDLTDTVEGVLRTHDVSLWNGTDTSLSSPTTAQYFGAAGQIAAGGNTVTIGTTQSIVDGLKSTIAQMLANSSIGIVRYCDHLCRSGAAGFDRQPRDEDGVQRGVTRTRRRLHEGGPYLVKTLSTQAGDVPLIPEWTLSYTGTPGSRLGCASGLHRYGRHD